jgi:hypothetical protein
MYGLQLLSKEVLTLWGIKVGARAHPRAGILCTPLLCPAGVVPPAGPLTRRPPRQQINALILQGQWWRLVTPAFLHGNLVHLAVNCYSLYSLAPIVETLSGGPRLAAVYLAAAVAGNVASFYGSAAPSLGASGAVFGVGGALAVYFYRNKGIYGKRSDAVLRQLGNTLFINLVFGMTNARIDNWCAPPPLRAAPLRRAAGGGRRATLFGGCPGSGEFLVNANASALSCYAMLQGPHWRAAGGRGGGLPAGPTPGAGAAAGAARAVPARPAAAAPAGVAAAAGQVTTLAARLLGRASSRACSGALAGGGADLATAPFQLAKLAQTQTIWPPWCNAQG